MGISREAAAKKVTQGVAGSAGRSDAAKQGVKPETGGTIPSKRTTAITRLICESHIRDFIILKAAHLRPGWNCKYVSQKAIDQIDAKVRAMVIAQIKQHPTRGKTFLEVQ